MSVVPLLLGASDSLSVSYGMEPEQEALSIVSFKDREAASQLINEIKLRIHLQYRTDFFINQEHDQRYQYTFQ